MSAFGEDLRERLTARFGAVAGPWWDALPALVAELARRWEPGVVEPLGGGSTSVVLRCGRRVLKLTPEPALAAAEARALRGWAASGRVPAVLADDAPAGALLLEALPDPTPVLRSARTPDVSEAAELIAALHARHPRTAGIEEGGGFEFEGFWG